MKDGARWFCRIKTLFQKKMKKYRLKFRGFCFEGHAEHIHAREIFEILRMRPNSDSLTALEKLIAILQDTKDFKIEKYNKNL